MTTLGKRLIKVARKGRAIVRGEADPATYKVHVPARVNVKAMRARLRMTQAEFAMRYNPNIARSRERQQGRSQPDGAVRAYLKVIEREPQAVERALST